MSSSSSNLVDFARNFSVLVRVQGPDPKGLKMQSHAFHLYNSGKTTLSASGVLLPHTLCDIDSANRIYRTDDHNLMFVLTVASVIDPFLSQHHRRNLAQDTPQLIRGAQIDLMLQGGDKGESYWVAGKLMKLVDVPTSSLALESILKVSTGSLDNQWEFGWSLASDNNTPDQTKVEHGNGLFVGESSNPSLSANSATRLAIIGVSLQSKDLPNVVPSPLNKRGDFLLAMGSPFGVLSPSHFFNSISTGSVANCYPPNSADKALLMADIRCLPGMEGGPIFGEEKFFVGILIRPLRQRTSGAEIQLVLPWEAIATACGDLLLREPDDAGKRLQTVKGNLKALSGLSSKPVEKTMNSICLITIDGGIWASGILLNDQGLILTNAHLLEPWRFKKTSASGGRKVNESQTRFLHPEDSASQKSQVLEKSLEFSLANKQRNNLSLFSKRNGEIRVRLSHEDRWIWSDAKVVFVCTGPVDVALLQLEYVPDQLCPINVTFEHPPVGSTAYVIGHGLLGPQSGLSPSVSSGVVAKLVKAKMPLYSQYFRQEDLDFPVMLETTAAIHPGGSGGAVVNSDGHMIGLVTSNARHVGGKLIPHLNFSIPSAVLAPIFEFSRGMQDFSLLKILDQPNEHLSSVWSLMPPVSPKSDPPLPNVPRLLPEDSNKERKGSRFAKFIAERDELLKKPGQFGGLERLSDKNLRSKL
ncbi:hypothetical protein ACFE04_019969 [Oxalis oulophora]